MQQSSAAESAGSDIPAGKFAHGAPIKIFSRREIQDILIEARACGFE
jgi:hypothetical protein